jgi:hypothetical protein
MEIGEEGYFETVESRRKLPYPHLKPSDNDLIGFDESGISGEAKRGKSCSPGSPPQKAASRNLAGGIRFHLFEQRVCHTLLDYRLQVLGQRPVAGGRRLGYGVSTKAFQGKSFQQQEHGSGFETPFLETLLPETLLPETLYPDLGIFLASSADRTVPIIEQ